MGLWVVGTSPQSPYQCNVVLGALCSPPTISPFTFFSCISALPRSSTMLCRIGYVAVTCHIPHPRCRLRFITLLRAIVIFVANLVDSHFSKLCYTSVISLPCCLLESCKQISRDSLVKRRVSSGIPTLQSIVCETCLGRQVSIVSSGTRRS